MPISLPVRRLMIASGALAVFGRVADFIPRGVPRGSMWSPADLFLLTGMVLLWVGAVRARGRPPVTLRQT
jgi:hypothetical protein